MWRLGFPCSVSFSVTALQCCLQGSLEVLSSLFCYKATSQRGFNLQPGREKCVCLENSAGKRGGK